MRDTKDPPAVRPILSDRAFWVTVIRPILVRDGNLTLTPEMIAEEKQIREQMRAARGG